MEKVVQVVEPAKIMNQFPLKDDKFKNIRDIMTKHQKPILVIVGIAIVLLGIGTGKVLAKSGPGSTLPSGAQKADTPTITNSNTEAGISDVSSFADQQSPTGLLKEGGLKGDGNYHLERDGGPTQYVYLTSTVLDLGSFVGKKVQVWGQTISGKYAGWLMDVVKVKVVE